MATETRNLQLVLDLKDRATGQLQGFRGQLEKMQPAFRKMALGGTIAFGAISAGIFKTTQDAAKAEGAWNKFNTVFGDGAEEMKKFIVDLREEMPTATDQIVKMAADMQDLLIPMGLARDEAQGLTGGFLDLANKVAAFNDVPVERVLNALKSALVGSSEPLRAFGVDARVDALEELAKDMGLVEDGFKELAPAARASVTAQVLFEQATIQSADAINGFEENQDSFIRRQQELQATIQDVSVALGNAFLPMMDAVLKKILPVVEKIADWVEQNPELARNILIVTAAAAGLVAVAGTVGIILLTITTASLIFAGALGALIAVGVLVMQNWDKIKSFGEKLKEGFFDLLDGVKATYTEIKDATIEFVESAKEKLMEWWDTWRNFIIFIAGVITGLYLPKLTIMAVQTAIQLGKMVVAWTISTAKIVTQIGIQTATAIPGLIASYAKAAAAAVVTAGKVVAQWVIMGIQSLIQAGRMALAWVIAMGPVAWVSALIIGLVVLIIANWDTVKRVTIDVFTAIGKFLMTSLANIKKAIGIALEFIKTKWTEGWTAVKDFFTGIWDSMLGKVESWVESVTDFLEPVIDMINRIQSGVGAVGGRFSRGISNIGSAIGVNDAVITPQGQVIHTDPADFLFATKNPDSLRGGGGVTVNITGGTFLSEDAAEEMGDIIIRKFKMSRKL